MNIQIILCVIAVSFSGFANSSEVVVRFINGVFVHEECSVGANCAKKSTEELRSILQRNEAGLDVQLSYNNHESKFKDTYEAIIQGVKGDVGLKKLSSFFHDNLSPESYSNFVKAKQQQYSVEVWEYALKKEFFGEALSAQNQFKTANTTPMLSMRNNPVSVPVSLARFIEDIAMEITVSLVSRAPNYENSEEYRNYVEILKEYNGLLYNGIGVVIVCHSQGCFFANKIAKRLDSPFLKIVAVATPASYVYGGVHVTLKTDLIMKPSMLNWNVKNDKRYSYNGHAFVEDYLAGENSRNKIVQSVKDAMTDIKLARTAMPDLPKTKEGIRTACAGKGTFIKYDGDGLKKRLSNGWIWWSGRNSSGSRLLIKPITKEQCEKYMTRVGLLTGVDWALYDYDGCKYTRLGDSLRMNSIATKLCKKHGTEQQF